MSFKYFTNFGVNKNIGSQVTICGILLQRSECDARKGKWINALYQHWTYSTSVIFLVLRYFDIPIKFQTVMIKDSIGAKVI